MKNVIISGYMVAVLVGLSSCQTSGGVSGIRSLNTTSWGYMRTKEMARAGKESQRFELRPGDCGSDSKWSDCSNDRSRSEISVEQTWLYGVNKWIGFSVYLPKNFKTSSKLSTSVGQVHQEGGPTGMAGGYKSFPPMMQMEMKGKNYRMCVHILSGDPTNIHDSCRYLDIARVSEMRGKWTDIMINFDTSDDQQIMDVYVNDKKKASISDWITFKATKYYLKYGIYNSFISRHGGPMPTQVLYFDEVKIGSSMELVRINEDTPVD